MNDLKDFMGCTNIINASRVGNIDFFLRNHWDEFKKKPLELTAKASKYNNRTAYSFAANAPHNREGLLYLMYDHDLSAYLMAPDDQDRTPLMYAVNFGDKDAISALKTMDPSSFNRVDKDGRNILHLLCLPGDWSPKMDSILDKNDILPSDPSIRQLKAGNLYDGALYTLEMLGIIAVQGQLKAKDRFGMTPVDYAYAFKFDSIIDVFINFTNNFNPEHFPLPDDVTIFGRDALQRYITSTTSNKDYKSKLPSLLNRYDPRVKNPENGNINAVQLAYLYNKEPDFIAILEADLISKDKKNLLAQDNQGAIALHYAAQSNRFNSIECIKRHLKRLEDQELLFDAIKHKDNEGRTALHVLVMTHTDDDSLSKQVEAYRCLLEHGADFFALDNNGNTSYALAKLYGNNKLAEAISRLANPKLEHRQQNVLSQDAFKIVHPKVSPPKQNLKDYLDRDFVIRCILSANLHLEDYLKEKRFAQTINTPVARYGNMAPLHFVAQALKHQTQLASILIQSGADVSQLDDKGRSPIFYAANLQDKDLMELYLWNKDSLISARDKDGRNLIHAVCMGGLFKRYIGDKKLEKFEDAVPWLSGVPLNQMVDEPDNFGLSPAMYAKYNNYTNVYGALAQCGINIDNIILPTDPNLIQILETDFYGFNPLMQAAYRCKAPSQEIEEKYKKEKNSMWGGDNGLHFWQEWYLYSNAALANKVLLELSPTTADNNIPNNYGSTILHLKIFAIACNPKLLEFWLQKPEIAYFTSHQINIKDKNGNTPLHVIAMFPNDLFPGNENGNYFFSDTLSLTSTPFTIKIAQALIDRGADIYAKNKAGQSAYDLAVLYGNNELRDYLLQHLTAKDAESAIPTLGCTSSCLHFGYSLKKLLRGSLIIKQSNVDAENDPEDLKRKPLLKKNLKNQS